MSDNPTGPGAAPEPGPPEKYAAPAPEEPGGAPAPGVREEAGLAGPLVAELLDALPQGAALVRVDGRIVRVNRRLRVLLRLPDDLDPTAPGGRERLLDHIASLLPGPGERARFLAAARPHGPVTRTADHLLTDGRILRRRRSSLGGPGRPWGHLLLIEDVTRRHEAREDLDQRVRRLAALTDERAAFAGRALHELRTPLATVLSFTELLLDPAGGPLDPERTAFLEAILRNVRRMVSIAENLPRAAGEDPSGPRAAAPRPGRVLVPELVERVVLDALQRTGGAGPYLTADVPEGGPPLYADGWLLTGALEELVANALRFTPADGRVEVGARFDDAQWTVRVRDTGIGVPLEYQEEVFTPYVRAPNARRGGYPGTGLGLAGALEAVRLHGGTLTVRDRRSGPGAVFTVRLPRRDVPEDSARGGPGGGPVP
ncbi:sensor histidine kinase KdpD [Streptomyces griseus]|uniref:sensor histidine kinase n=1 Tax=Streptomyces griseus TaxID=1911 RepID=UPI00068EBD43|nr:HAMP domain-containing sensor histidine kinase [Streptomyces griseus]